MRVCELRLLVHHSSEAEVAYLDVAVGVQENVAGFQVPVQDFLRQVTRALRLAVVDLVRLQPPVALVETQRDLHQYFPNDVFRDVVLLLATASDYHSEVSSLAVLHYDVDLLGALVDYAVVVLHDVGVRQVSQDVYL